MARRAGGVLDAVVCACWDRPASTLSVWVLVIIVAGVGLFRLPIDTATSSFLDRSAPEWAVYSRSVAAHGSDEFVVVAFPTSEVLDSAARATVRDLTTALSIVPGVRRVDSLSSVPMIRSGRDGFVRFDPVLEASPATSSPASSGEIVGWVREDSLAPRSLISDDGKTLALNIVLDDDFGGDRAAIVSGIREVLGSSNYWITGVPVFRTAVNEQTRAEILLLTPITLALIAVLLLAVFRRASAVVAALVGPLIGTVGTIGAMGWLGQPLSLSTMVLPSVLLALGCAYSVHFLVAVSSPRADRRTSMREIARPVALSGLTTVLGFLAIATVRIDAIRALGSFGALGVFLVTLATLTATPAILSRWERTVGIDVRESVRWERVAQWLSSIACQHPRVILGSWLLGAVLAVVGIAKLEVSTDIIQWFPAGSAIRDDYEEIRSRLSGITPVNILVESEPPYSVTHHAVLRDIEAIVRALRERGDIGKVVAISDALDQTERVLSPRPGASWRTDADLADQYLLLLSGMDRLGDLVADDRSSASIVLRLNDNRSSAILGLETWVRAWWDRNASSSAKPSVTGIMYEFARSEDDIARGQLQGLSLAAVAIGVVLLLSLGSPVASLLALVPNAFPLAMVFGAMGFFGIALDAATVCLGSMALGIAVDDTIHVTTRFADAQRDGIPPDDAVLRAVRGALRAVSISTMLVAAGFGVLAFSEFTLVQHLGLMTTAVVVLCLVADLTLLPALLRFAGRAARA